MPTVPLLAVSFVSSFVVLDYLPPPNNNKYENNLQQTEVYLPFSFELPLAVVVVLQSCLLGPVITSYWLM